MLRFITWILHPRICYISFNNFEISSNLGVKITSIRLFFALPSAVSLCAIGANSPRPAAVKFSGLIDHFL